MALKSLDKVRARPWVAFVDDEREMGNSIIVTLKDQYDFVCDPGCGVRGFDSAREAMHYTQARAVKLKHFPQTA
jgi:hypothetical protein